MPLLIIAAIVAACAGLHIAGYEELFGLSSQEEYYNNFGKLYKTAILASLRPHLWTTDADTNGKVHEEMKRRIARQEHFVDKHFFSGQPVLDVGCGFGRQAFLLASKGFTVFGIDTSRVFVDIAKALFAKHGYPGEFACANLMKHKLNTAYKNVLLLDVLEHIIPHRRRTFMQRVYGATQPGGIVIMSLPHDTAGMTWKKRIKQYIPYYTNKEEHPYAIPQRGNVEQISRNLFTVEDSLVTEETDYYILKRL